MIYLDEKIGDHPKFVGLPGDVCWLWVRMIGYSRDQKTDGYVPEVVALRLGRSPRMVRRWLAIGLSPSPSAPHLSPIFERAEGGYRVHDFLDWNKSRAELAAESEDRRRAGRVGGVRSGQARSKQLASEQTNPPISDLRSPIPTSDPQQRDPEPRAQKRTRRVVQPELIPTGSPPAADSPHKRVTAAYFESYERERGERPAFGSREGKAVTELLGKLGGDPARAIRAIENAFADPWGASNATIVSIAANPAKWQGARANGGPKPIPAPTEWDAPASPTPRGLPSAPTTPKPADPFTEEQRAENRRRLAELGPVTFATCEPPTPDEIADELDAQRRKAAAS